MLRSSVVDRTTITTMAVPATWVIPSGFRFSRKPITSEIRMTSPTDQLWTPSTSAARKATPMPSAMPASRCQADRNDFTRVRSIV